MDKKPILTIKQEKEISPGYKTFNISTKVEIGRWLFWRTYSSGVIFLNKNGYLARLINNLKDNDKAYYILFSRRLLPGDEYSLDGINKTFSLSDSNITILTINPIPGIADRIKKGGIEIYGLMIRDGEKIQKIIDCLFGSYAELYFIFDSESNKETLFSKFKKFKTLDAKNIIPLSQDILKLSMTCCSADEELKIFTNRFDKSQIKARILDSIDPNEIEVL